VKLAWLAYAAVAAVAVAALVDAVRRDEAAPAPPAATTAEIVGRDAIAAQLAELGARGELVLCGEAALALPSLEPREPGPCPADQVSVVIPQAELDRAARLHPRVPDLLDRVRVLVDDTARLSETRVAAALSIRLGAGSDRLGPLSSIAFFEGGRLVPSAPYFRVTGGDLDASPRGTYVTQTPDVILRRDGSQVSLPQHLRDSRAFAWSPDERLVALAGRHAVTVVDVASLEEYDRTSGGLRSVTITQPAVRLAWRDA
jgi:hypothetical protein